MSILAKPQKPTVAQQFGLVAPQAYSAKKDEITPASTSNDALMCGIELEIENTAGFTYYQDRVGPFWTITEDGSLRPRGASFEFISKPARLSVLVPQLHKFFQKFEFNERNYTDRCSVHLHTNVLDFTQEQLASLAMIYTVFEEVLFQFVNHFKAPDERGYYRDTNIYCIPWNQCRMNAKLVDTIFRNAHQVRNWQKYTALNLLPITTQGTVEWRHMHGTNDMEKLTTWLNVIGAIMKYAKTTEFDEVVRQIKVLNDVSTYQQFFTDVLQGYLPYTDAYRKSLADGVVYAKWSLMTHELRKKNPALADAPVPEEEEEDPHPSAEHYDTEEEYEEAVEDWNLRRVARTRAAVRNAPQPPDWMFGVDYETAENRVAAVNPAPIGAVAAGTAARVERFTWRDFDVQPARPAQAQPQQATAVVDERSFDDIVAEFTRQQAAREAELAEARARIQARAAAIVGNQNRNGGQR